VSKKWKLVLSPLAIEVSRSSQRNANIDFLPRSNRTLLTLLACSKIALRGME